MNLRAALVLAVAVSACATGSSIPMSGASWQTGADYSRYRTFDFLPIPAGGARIAATMDYFAVEGALADELSTVGNLPRSISGDPDLVVAYFQGGRQVDVTLLGYRTAGGDVVDPIDVPSSCLVVDLVDARTRVLVWRGIATDALSSASAMRPAIRQMLQQGWPPRG